jgi:spore coat polysaccharide biosynthesis protein SpsF (cytidylyltransferase family)
MATGIIIQARLNSSRLPEKALLKIGKYVSLQWCVLQCSKMKGVDKIILATTFEKEDMKLKAMYEADAIIDSVYRGSRDDLLIRYYGAAKEHGIDTIIRLTGDCPVFSHEIGEILLKSHLETGADYTEAVKCAVGTSCQVWEREIFVRLLEMGVNWKYSEHMSYFVVNNPDIFQVNRVDLLPELVRDYRLTLDYQEDLDMLRELFAQITDYGCSHHKTEDVFWILDQFPTIARINAHCKQVFDSSWLQAELKRENDRIRSKL